MKARFPVSFAGWLLLVLATPGLLAQSSRQLTQGSQSQNSARRIALVIGNGTYASAPALKNPSNDARDVAATLQTLGFEVSSGVNIGQRAMKRLIREFGQKLKGGGSGLFYYAGHGVQSKGRNYLIPIDAEIQSEAEVEDSGVDVGLVLNYMDEAQNGLNIVILDACRNNPFGRSFRSAAEGLAQVDAPTGTLIAYATAPGRVASDGTGQNGLYTSELLKQMRVPSVSVTDMFMRVRAEVMKQTGNKQVPWESSSLVGAFYFSGNSATSNTASGSDKNTTPPPVNPTTIELSFWDSIKNSTSAEDFNAYLRKYPNGEFADLARIRAANLSKDSSYKPQPPKGDRGGIGVQFEVLRVHREHRLFHEHRAAHCQDERQHDAAPSSPASLWAGGVPCESNEFPCHGDPPPLMLVPARDVIRRSCKQPYTDRLYAQSPRAQRWQSLIRESND
jgi:hypothetical protein